jgi:hypothetical protein
MHTLQSPTIYPNILIQRIEVSRMHLCRRIDSFSVPTLGYDKTFSYHVDFQAYHGNGLMFDTIETFTSDMNNMDIF